jgi:peptidoglycan hydrolase-like protein with peptidoglycan-binding domain
MVMSLSGDTHLAPGKQTMATSIQIKQPFLRSGSTGMAVEELQELLQKYARFIHARSVHPGAIDGVFGPRTQSAVLNFQMQVFLPTTGVVADYTWTALYNRAPVDMPLVRRGSQGEVVEQLQVRLKLAGYYNGAIGGHFGQFTYAAVRNFQRDMGLMQDGDVGENTWYALSKIVMPSAW